MLVSILLVCTLICSQENRDQDVCCMGIGELYGYASRTPAFASLTCTSVVWVDWHRRRERKKSNHFKTSTPISMLVRWPIPTAPIAPLHSQCCRGISGENNAVWCSSNRPCWCPSALIHCFLHNILPKTNQGKRSSKPSVFAVVSGKHGHT